MRLPFRLFRPAVVSMAIVFAGCTFGLGQYAVQGSDALEPDAANERGVDASLATPTGAADSGDENESDGGDASAGGLCAEAKKQTCRVPDGDAGDAGTCTGEQQCIQSKWGPCQVDRTCPTTWRQNTLTACKNTDAIGNAPAPPWTTNQAQGADETLWVIDRQLPFDTYGQNDRFCFVPKQFGNCYTTSTTAIDVLCTSSAKKLSGNDFAAGSIHGRVYCVDRTGPTCRVVDRHTAAWTPPGATVPCTRWFEQAAFVVEAAPRCAAW